MKLSRTRTNLELRVGKNAVVDIVLHVRKADLQWFNNNDNESSDSDLDHTADLFQVLQQSVLPRMFQNEIEDSHYASSKTSSDNSSNTKPPPKLGPGGIPILAGEERKNHNKEKNVNIPKKGQKRKRAPPAKKTKDVAGIEDDDEKTKAKLAKDVFYAFGKNLQLAYRCEDISKLNTASFTFRNEKGHDSSGILHELDRLPKRIVAWIFPFDPSRPSEADPSDGGFPIPERIPIAHLFRSGMSGNPEDDHEANST